MYLRILQSSYKNTWRHGLSLRMVSVEWWYMKCLTYCLVFPGGNSFLLSFIDMIKFRHIIYRYLTMNYTWHELSLFNKNKLEKPTSKLKCVISLCMLKWMWYKEIFAKYHGILYKTPYASRVFLSQPLCPK